MRSHEYCTYLPSINSCDNESIGFSLQEYKKEERHIGTRTVIKTNF